MTEHEWLTCANPWDMINFAREAGGTRKLRLFACACCRQVLNPFAPPLAERAVAAAEAFADGDIRAEVLAGVRAVVAEAAIVANREDGQNGTGYLSYLLGSCLSACYPGDPAEVAQDAAHATARAAADTPWPATGELHRGCPDELAAQAELMRDLFGNPFQSLELRLEWLTDTVLALARGIYADRAFDRMPIMADALQDAGCDDDEILNHCREPREHARGCWVVDLLLGKS